MTMRTTMHTTMRTAMSRRAFARGAVLGALAAGGLATGSPGARAADLPGGADWRAATDPQRLFLTFTSSSGWGLWPRQAADAITPRLRGYLGGLDRSTRPVLGTVPMDFVTADLARSLYALNFGA
ncbi:hypothetical protein [Kitasatospora purpeofusca]|uniref:hypothetical protein n=1 Tax=Kitasatospora purpeofusca TaxID=67352 RepID=UPI0038664D50|nr:hypothetical protein OIP63_37265 [Kitasatospora purpeofusca]